MRVKHLIAAGALSLSAVAGLAGPAYAAPAHHGPSRPAPRPVFKADACALIARPLAGQQETLLVRTTAGRTVVQVEFFSGRKEVGKGDIATNAFGTAAAALRFGNLPKYDRVTVVGRVVAAPRGYRAGAVCATSFFHV